MTFNINKFGTGEVKKVTLADGTIVNKVSHIFVEELGALIPCTDYGDHFIYTNPDTQPGTPSYLCTCGAVAVVAPLTNDGHFVCLFDLESGLKGYHTTSLYSSKDIVKGKVLRIDDIRKELI